MKALIDSCKAMLRHETVASRLHKGHNYAHMAYLGAVGAEAHGVYGVMALVLLAVTVVMHFAGLGEE